MNSFPVRAYKTLRRIRKRGFRYYFYLFTGYLVPALQYSFYYELGIPGVARIATALAILWAIAAATILFGGVGAVSVLAFCLLISLARRKAIEARTQRHARALYYQAQMNQRAEDFLLHMDATGTGDSVMFEARPVLRDNYDRDRLSFLWQWHNLSLLEDVVNVPTVFSVDPRNNAIWRSFVPGETVEVMFSKNPGQLNYLPDEVLAELEEQMNRIHQQGIAGFGESLNKVVIHYKDSSPWFVDLSKGRKFHSTKSFSFIHARDLDRIHFNQLFQASLLTEESARLEISSCLNRRSEWYAPVDLGHGLTIGHFWSVDKGTGRWEHFNKGVMERLVRDKRILDLGSGNSVMDLMMLRAGAREVIGFESSPQCADAARRIHRLFEWRDNCRYSLLIRNCRITELLHCDPGPIDMITAFGSFDILSQETMAIIIQRAAVLSPLLVIQAHMGRNAGCVPVQQSGIEFLRHMLQTNGFPYVRIHATPGIARPLLIARKEPEHTTHRQELVGIYGEPLPV